MHHHVIIVGGGISGLAAAVGLCGRQIRVTLLEQKPALGGRAYSYKDSRTGEIIDNGQHVLIAGYEHTLRFLETVGTRGLLKIQSVPRLLLHHPRRGFLQFTIPLLPAPLNLLMGILTSSLFSLPDRIRMVRAGMALQKSPGETDEDLTVDAWLSKLHQSADAKAAFWEPLAVSIMNEHISVASAHAFHRALRQAFLGGRQAACIALPRVGLSKLFVDGARKYIEHHGGKVLCGADVVGLRERDGYVQGVDVRGDIHLPADAVILAVPPQRAASLLPAGACDPSWRDKLMTMPYSPIISVHLWFHEQFMPHEMLGIIGRRVQWVFNTRAIADGNGEGAHVSAVISAADEFVSFTNDELVGIVLEDLRSVYGEKVREPFHTVVIREKRATVSSTPATYRVVRTHQTQLSNLSLAGDWTIPLYPSTIEGAVMSAHIAVDLTCRSLFGQNSHRS